MAYFGSSLTAPSSGLTAANINTLIQQTLSAQREPIKTLTARKDTLNVEKAVYSDLKSKLSTLKSVIENLMSDDDDTVFDDVSTTSSDSDVVTATATSSALNGNYTINVKTLAEAHRVSSDSGATSASAALGLDGTFTLNGADITIAADDSLEAIAAAINAAEYGESLSFSVGLDYKSELDSGLVSAELRADFAAQGITLSEDATASIKTEDSRWLITDHGKKYSVRDGGTQLDIYKGGREVAATIVDNYLILEGVSTGLDQELVASGDILKGSLTAGTGLGILDADGDFIADQERAAADASFTVNGLTVTRGSNTGLDDVMDGVTLNLLSVAEAELEVVQDHAAISAKISAFVNNLNSTVSYLKAKTGTTADVEKQTYTRGALAGKTIFSMLKMDLIMAPGEQVAGRSLADIGITIGDGLEVSLDTSKLNTELESNFDGVVQLFDGVMQEYLTILEPFTVKTSSSNTIDLYSDSVETKIENIDDRIERMEKLLLVKEEMLIKQYSGLYMQSMQLQEQQQSLFSLYASFSTYA